MALTNKHHSSRFRNCVICISEVHFIRWNIPQPLEYLLNMSRLHAKVWPFVKIEYGVVMKKVLFIIIAVSLSFSINAQMKLQGVFDGPITGGIPKVIEIYVTSNIADLSTCGFGSANNGGGTDGQEFTFSGSASAGDTIYVATEQPQFNAYFGFDPDFTTSVAGINGDDAIELYCGMSVIDVFGEITHAGAGTWSYLDGWAYRNAGTGPDGTTFQEASWTFSGNNATDGCTTNGTCASQFPIGTLPVELENFSVE